MTTGIYSFVSVILNIAFVALLIAAMVGFALGSASLVALLVIKFFSDQVKIEDTSQLINDISSVFQKLLKYVNGRKILTFSFFVLIPSNFSVMLVL